MNDTFKWTLIAIASMVAVFFGVNALGLDWGPLHQGVLSILETMGLLLLLATGSFAAIEVGKYYRNQNRLLMAEHSPRDGVHSSQDRDRLDAADIHEVVQQAVEKAMLQTRAPAHGTQSARRQQTANQSSQSTPEERTGRS